MSISTEHMTKCKQVEQTPTMKSMKIKNTVNLKRIKTMKLMQSAKISMNIWNHLLTGRGETRYMHRSPTSSANGDIVPKVTKESHDTFII